MPKASSSLSRRVRSEIKKQKLTGSDVAQRTGLSEAAISRFTRGSEPTLASFEKLIALLGWEVRPKAAKKGRNAK